VSIDYSRIRDEWLKFSVRKAYINLTLGSFREVPPANDPTGGGLFNAICGDDSVYLLRDFRTVPGTDLVCLTVLWRGTTYLLDVRLPPGENVQSFKPGAPERIRISAEWVGAHHMGDFRQPDPLVGDHRSPDVLAAAYENQMRDADGRVYFPTLS
jgi:hypothetical protein